METTVYSILDDMSVYRQYDLHMLYKLLTSQLERGVVTEEIEPRLTTPELMTYVRSNAEF